MSKESLFDGISRILASSISRRRAFRLIVGGLATGTVVSFVEPERAYADVLECGDLCGNELDMCNEALGTCPTGTTCIGSILTKCKCCSALCGIFNDCCCPGQTCTGGECVGSCAKSNTGPTPEHCNATTARLMVASVQEGPPIQLHIEAQIGVDAGIASIAVASALSSAVTTAMPMDAGGTQAPVPLTVTKLDHFSHSRIVFAITDTNGNTANKEPIFTVLKVNTGTWAKQTFFDLTPEQGHLMLTNNNPGLDKLQVWVNSKLQSTVSLTPNEILNLDVTAAMTEAENTISLVGFGDLSRRAHIIITDTTPGDYPVTPQVADFCPFDNPIWGPLAEYIESNFALQVADSATQSIHLNLSATLGSNIGSDASVFSVSVNGKLLVVQGVDAEPGPNGSTNLTLNLQAGGFARGNVVHAYWEGIPEASGRLLSGIVTLLAT